MSDEIAISIKNLTKSFGKVKVLEGLNLEVKKGTVLALLGPNGAGKTTTVRILSTLLKADSGTVLVNGFNADTDSDKIRESIGLTGQYAAVDELLTGIENLEMMGRLYHLSSSDSKQRAKQLIEVFDLVEASTRPVKTYSGGMRRRLDLAASLIATPPIIFLDEPTTGLDPRSRLAMWEIIEKLVEAKVTILLTTQYLEEADKLADKIAVLDNGRIIAEGTADELKSKVGKDRLELVISPDSNFKEAVRIISGEEGVLSNDKHRTLSIATVGHVADLRRILDLMEKASIQIESLSLHKPTLDDVFMSLTGHKADKEMSEEKEGEQK
jgi:ABC-2 type transport system ATP-binding protein